MRSPRRLPAHLIAVALMISAASGTAACGQAPSSPPSQPKPVGARAFDTRAAKIAGLWPATSVARAWTTSVVPLQALRVLPPASEFTATTLNALNSGDFTFPASLPPAPARPGRVTYPGGSTIAVPLSGARDTIAKNLYRTEPPDPPCPATAAMSAGCSLTGTRVTLGSTKLWTSRGEAIVPAWLLTIAQFKDPIALIAVQPSALTTFKDDRIPASEDEIAALRATNSVVRLDSVDAARIRYTVRTGDCDGDIQARVFETPVVVVIGAIHTTLGGPCLLIGRETPIDVVLKAPLGHRALLDISSGYPATMD